ncbi:purine and uridine phosphorylase, partial [Aspergillus novofumigatus IBT 16806]
MPQTVRKFAHGDYTVGWICALPETEFVAAGAMLDEEHPVLPAVQSQDTNSYLLGRIGDHNIVIACLPAETTGKVSAATVAKDMLRSFPAVRFGLMVGIGGGAPYYGTQGYDNNEFSEQEEEEEDSEDDLEDIRDIRLGDVVVSLHSKSAEAVVQYDFGKSLQEKEFVHTGGKLNKPPVIVLSAVSVLQQQHRRKGHTTSELLADALSKNPGMAEEFRYPGSAKDRLFKPDIVHLEGRKSCKACCGPNNVNLVRRTDRHGTAPKIHYGTIGSADQVMRDAVLRDKWAQKEKIICFEMEAAGLMDSFPCLVIRGICDYADSHKNKIWQPYAAATAASYAKELLLVIPGQGVMDLCPIKQSLGKIEANVDTMRSKLARKEDHDLLNWITPDDYGPLQSDYFRRRQAGTGEWLLNSMEFQMWLKTSRGTLFCPGIPGAGKTILTSVVINYLTRRTFEDGSLGVAYVYCNFQRKDEQTADRLLSSLLKQLSGRLPTIPGEVSNLYNQHKTDRTRPSLEEISRTLYSVAVKYSRVFILVDALDEC